MAFTKGQKVWCVLGVDYVRQEQFVKEGKENVFTALSDQSLTLHRYGREQVFDNPEDAQMYRIRLVDLQIDGVKRELAGLMRNRERVVKDVERCIGRSLSEGRSRGD